MTMNNPKSARHTASHCRYRTIYASDRDGLPLCRMVLCVDSGGLTATRYDFQEWELNRRDGIVETGYCFDRDNTLRLADLLGATTPLELIREMKRRFGHRTGHLGFTQNMLLYCDDNGIRYRYFVWY